LISHQLYQAIDTGLSQIKHGIQIGSVENTAFTSSLDLDQITVSVHDHIQVSLG
jgi:hypothetical protein